jgi:IS30 family transposase
MSGGTYLELEERERLAALKAEGLGLRAIARRLGRCIAPRCILDGQPRAAA